MESNLTQIDWIICLIFLVGVIAIGVLSSRKESSSEDYFLAGRGLKWWLIGFSLIAANISAEQFVGMSGQAARNSIGLAVASYEWIAAVTLVIVAFFFLPTFLRSGIYTIPEFLEYRYNHAARLIMSLLMVLVYVIITLPTVIYLGAKALDPLFTGSVLQMPIDITLLSWVVGLTAAIYVFVGGLKACAWADLVQGTALILGGIVIMYLALQALDRPHEFEGVDAAAISQSLGVGAEASLGEKLQVLKERKMHMVLPSTSTFLPWTALLFGIWIPNLYYWGLNQYIMQRTLGASSLAQGQRGIVFAAGLKLIIPFIVCIPGIISFELYADKMHRNAMEGQQLNASILRDLKLAQERGAMAGMYFQFDADFARLHPDLAQQIVQLNAAVAQQPVPPDDDLAAANATLVAAGRKANPYQKVSQELVGYDYDSAFPLLIRYLTPPGIRGFVVAALMGAVISTLAAMLNAASTIFTMDIYRELINPNANQKALVWFGRCCIPVAVVIGCVIAPNLADPRFSGAFAYIQEFQGYVSPGVLTIFLFGLFVPYTPRIAGMIGLIIGPLVYGGLHLFVPQMAFLNRMAVSVVTVAAVLTIVTLARPLSEPIKLPTSNRIPLESSRGAAVGGIVVVLVTAALYVAFF